MKSEIKLYDKDDNFIKVFESVKECAKFFDKDKNYIYYNLKYMDKIRKEGKWFKIRRIIQDEKQEEIDRLRGIIKEAITYILAHCEIIRHIDENVDEVGNVNGKDLLNILNKGSEDHE